MVLALVLAVGLLAAPLALMPSSAMAVDVLQPTCSNPNASSTPTVCADNNTTNTNPILGPQGIVTTIVRLMSLALGIISVVMVIIGGFKFILSSGDPKAAESGRNTVLYALVGIAVAGLAQIMVTFVLSTVKG